MFTRATGGCSALVRSRRWINLRPQLAVVYGEEVARQAQEGHAPRSRTVAESWSADAQAGLEAFLDDNPCAEYGHVCHRTTIWRATKQLFTPFKKVTCQTISAANKEKRKNLALRTSLELRAFIGRARLSTRWTWLASGSQMKTCSACLFAPVPRISVSGCAVQSPRQGTFDQSHLRH